MDKDEVNVTQTFAAAIGGAVFDGIRALIENDRPAFLDAVEEGFGAVTAWDDDMNEIEKARLPRG